MIDFDSLPRFKSCKFQIFQLIPEWARCYGVSEQAILKQIQWAHAWCQANPERAPKKKPVRFLHNWMRITHEYGKLVDIPAKISYKENAPEGEVMNGEDWAKMKAALKR